MSSADRMSPQELRAAYLKVDSAGFDEQNVLNLIQRDS